MARIRRENLGKEHHRTTVMDMAEYKSGNHFTIRDVRRNLHLADETMSQVLRDMLSDGLVNRHEIPNRYNSGTKVSWSRRQSKCFNPARVSWRKHTNGFFRITYLNDGTKA